MYVPLVEQLKVGLSVRLSGRFILVSCIQVENIWMHKKVKMKINYIVKNSKVNLRLFLCVSIINLVVSYLLANVLTLLNFTFFLSALRIESAQKTSLFSLFVYFVVIGPAIEEYIFRYPSILLLRKNINSKTRTFLIYFVSSFMFAIIHSMGEIRFPIIQFFIGFFSLYIGSKTNIYHCIAFHSLNNFIAILQF